MAIDLDCASCKTDEHVRRAPDETLSGTQRRLRCTECGHEWVRGDAAPKEVPLPTLEDIKKRFPGPDDVDPAKLAGANELKAEFLRKEPDPEPNVAPYWKKYQHIFSAEGLATPIRRKPARVLFEFRDRQRSLVAVPRTASAMPRARP